LNGSECKKVALCTGFFPGDFFSECWRNEIDTIICGENKLARHLSKPAWRRSKMEQQIVSIFKDLKINLLCFGHEATEQLGLHALKDYLLQSGYHGDIRVCRLEKPADCY
jgi:putative NIF3 family GTP cyclohydrolase 1 type 2